MSAVYSNESPDITRLESNSPLRPSAAVPAVHVCAALSVFEKITFPPTSTVASIGLLHPSKSSHPGVCEPAVGTIVTSVCAKAAGVIAPIPATIANNTKNEQIALVFIKQVTCMDT